jgi:VWFA-related protein
MRPSPSLLFAFVLTIALPTFCATPADSAASPGVSTATPAQQQPTVQTIQVFSRETIVDVLVTDAKGNPVRNLKQSDFTIKEDNKPQPIRSFAEFGVGQQPAHRLPPLPSGVHTNNQATPATGPVNIILIDALHSSYVATVRSLQATAAYVRRMPEGTQVAIFWLSSSGLHMLQGFTSDPALLLAAAETKRTDIGSSGDCHNIDWVTVQGLQQIAEYVAAIKGRKNLIWFTPGMPVYLLRDGGYGWGATSSCRDSNGRQFGNMLPYVDPANVTSGFSNPTSDALFGDQSLFAAPTLFMGNNDGLNMGMVHRLMDTYEIFSGEQIAVSPVDPAGVGRIGASQLVATEVAEQSGGVAKYNSNDLGSRMAEAIDEGSHYYTISYIPPRKKLDGHYHTITVEVDQPGLQLVYRKGYNSEDPKIPRPFAGPDLIKAALQGKTPAATQLLFDAKLEPAKIPPATIPGAPTVSQKSKPKPQPQRHPYDLLLAIPQSQITYATGPGGIRKVRLQFAFDAYDLNGKFLGSHSQDVSLDLPVDRFVQFIEEPVLFHEQIAFYPGPLFLRVGVLDTNSNKVGTLEIPLTVPTVPGQSTITHPPDNAPCPPRCPLPAPVQ